MTNLTIQTINSTLVVDSRLIASELGIEHRALKQLVRGYEADFEQFGNINISNVDIIGPGKPENIYYLNEDQAYLLLTFVKNTPEARQAKVNLVKAFKAAREALVESNQPKLPTNMIELAEACLTSMKAEEAAKQQLALVEAKVIEMQPKVEAYHRLAEDTGTFSYADAAKLIKVMGRNTLLEFLRKHKVLQFSNIAYQAHIDAGRFTVVEKETSVGVKVTGRVTQRGLEFIIRLLEKEGYIVPSKVA